jgi:hypothetical protein
MAAIISDKFRIFNAKQFLESLSEGANDASADRTRLYFFVGRPQAWRAYLEVYSVDGGSFTVGNEVYVGTNYGTATFRGTVEKVYSNSILLSAIFGSAGTASTPGAGSTLKEWDGSADTAVTAVTGVYRYATEDAPPLPLDNQTEKFSVYDDIIAAKRVTDANARAVIRRYNWDLSSNPKFDAWKPDYSSSPSGGGQIGKQTALGYDSIADAKFYVMNTNYEVFKCLYNGENPSNPTGQNATVEPSTAAAGYNGTTGIFTEGSGAGYVWKYMYTLPTDDVLKFLSSDFMPVVLPTESTRVAVEALAVNGSIDVALIEDAGGNLPPSQTLYAAIQGDGTNGVVQISTTAGGAISTATVVGRGQDYTYANVLLSNGYLYSDQGLTTGVATPAGATGAIEVVLPPKGGHGSAADIELNAKRVMTNIRLTYAEGSGDFPVDNDFRRIGLLTDPYDWGTTSYATASTLNGMYAVKITGSTADYIPDEVITQVRGDGNTAKGTVVSWTLDSGSTTDGILKYYQSPDQHLHNGAVYPFEANGAVDVGGAASAADGNVDTTYNGTLEGVTLANGLGTPEIANNSGDIIYIENRRLITRAPDQIEDIKLVIEF